MKCNKMKQFLTVDYLLTILNEIWEHVMCYKLLFNVYHLYRYAHLYYDMLYQVKVYTMNRYTPSEACVSLWTATSP